MSYELILSVHIIVAKKNELVSLCLVSFTYGVLGQVWYLIVSTPDLCLLPYVF